LKGLENGVFFCYEMKNEVRGSKRRWIKPMQKTLPIRFLSRFFIVG
jgi:hypothetical protein